MKAWSLIGLLLTLTSCAPVSGENEMNDPQPVELVVTLGESIFALAGRAPALIRTESMDDNGPAIIERLIRLTLIAHGRQITLPATRLVIVKQVAGVVTGAELAPMLEFGDLAACRELALLIGNRARAAGWQTREAYPSDLATMQADAARSASRRYEKIFENLGMKSAQLSIYVKETRSARTSDRVPTIPDARFLLNTDFLDPVVEDAANKRLFSRRRQETGGTGSLPLEVWRPR